MRAKGFTSLSNRRTNRQGNKKMKAPLHDIQFTLQRFVDGHHVVMIFHCDGEAIRWPATRFGPEETDIIVNIQSLTCSIDGQEAPAEFVASGGEIWDVLSEAEIEKIYDHCWEVAWDRYWDSDRQEPSQREARSTQAKFLL